MERIVLKFGGTSLANIEKILSVSRIVQQKHKNGGEIIVVVSAMSGVTNDLIGKSKKISSNFEKAELDTLLSSGEQASSALLAAAIVKLGIKSRSWLSWQIPILTEGNFGSSRILHIETKKINNFIKSGGIPIIPGFQGISKDFRLTTLERGGSDASAVAIAKFFQADYCEIFTDVDGVYTADPNINTKAKKIDKISYDEMLEMSSLGAKVMQPNSIQTAMIYDIPIYVRSTFSNNEGTQIVSDEKIDYSKIVTGVTYSKTDAKITLSAVMDKPGVAAGIFKPISESNINVDMVVQNISPNNKQTDITFTIKREDLSEAIKLIENNKKNINYQKLTFDDKVSKVSIVGAGMISSPGVTFRMFSALAKQEINIKVISTSEIKISVLIDEEHVQKAVKVLHTEFNLD